MTEKLTGRQLKAIDAMLEGQSLVDAAAAAGVNDRTLRRWRQSPNFRTELTTRSTATLDDTTRQLGAATVDAVRVMRAIVNDDGAPYMVQLRAADMILSHHSRQRELYDLLERLDALEGRL